MQVIISHVNTDFDALASMIAAKKLYPEAQIVITDKQNDAVTQFLNIYRDTLPMMQDRLVDWDQVEELIIVDVAALERTGDYSKQLNRENLTITIYDHHPSKDGDIIPEHGIIEPLGAAVTLLIEEIRKQQIPISSFEATIFGLGIYTDTGSFTYAGTTARDLQAASYLMEQGMNLEIIQRFADQMLLPEQQELFNQLFLNTTEYKLDGLNILVAAHEQQKFQGGLSTLTRKLLEMTDADAVLVVVEMQKRVYIIGRASSNRINFLPLLKLWKGGGHEQAGSATIKNGIMAEVLPTVVENIEIILKPAITARDIMTTPVKTLEPKMTIEAAGKLMYRYGHSGFPIVEDGKLLGIISRRDLDKANHHGLGHAPVKGYMSSKIVTIRPETSIEEIQKIMIEHNVGRLPVVEDGKLLGILSRTNIIEVLHHKNVETNLVKTERYEHQLAKRMEEQLPQNIYALLQKISKKASDRNLSVYLIGGIVRDIILGKPNDDVDIVVEGDGIAFAQQLKEEYGGDVVVHESFGTATWEHLSGVKIDVTSSRLEYYERPAALPDVEKSTLKEDLERRDFTINAMAIYLTGEKFGEIVDPYLGARDIKQKTIKILHNLSFVEDPTRIFRAVRFETRFGFKMDNQTESLALQAMPGVKELSANRILYEMEKMFNEIAPERTIQRLFELGFWQQYNISKQVAASSCIHVKRLKSIYETHSNLGDKNHWFSYFLIPFYKAGQLKQAKQFALTKKEGKLLQEITELTSYIEWKNSSTIAELHQQLKIYSNDAILFMLVDETQDFQQFVLSYLEKAQNLPVYLTGADLIKKGLKPSAVFSKILFDLEVAILNNEVTSKEMAEQWLEEYLV